MTPSALPNIEMLRDAQRRGRMQEGAAIVLALFVLAATFVVAATSVAGGTVPSASRAEVVRPASTPGEPERCEQPMTITIVPDGFTASDRICSFGPEVHPVHPG